MSSFISLLLAGSVLHLFKSSGMAAAGFLTVFIVAMLARFSSAYWMGRYQDPGIAVLHSRLKGNGPISRLRPDGNLLQCPDW